MKLLLSLLIAAFLAPATYGLINIAVTTADGSGQDAYIDEESPTATEGLSDPQRLRFRTGSNAGQSRVALVQFDLGFLDSEIGAFSQTRTDIQSVSLNFATGSGDVIPLNEFGIFILADTSANDTAWDESTITWNNAPTDAQITSANNNSPDDSSTLPAANPAAPASRWTYTEGEPFAFTTNLLSEIQNDTNDSLTIAIQYVTDGVGSSLNLSSGENTTPDYRPTLDVTIIPEPSAISFIAGAGALGLLALRRRC